MKRVFINRFGVTFSAPILSISRLFVRVFTNSPLKSRLNPIHFLVRISIVVLFLFSVFTVCYFLSLVLGFYFSLIWVKLKSMLLFISFRFLFSRLLGWGVPLILLLCLVSGLGGVYFAHAGSRRRSTCCQYCRGATLQRAFRRIDLGLEKFRGTCLVGTDAIFGRIQRS